MLAVIFIILGLFLILGQYGWKGGIYYMLAASFLQDPIRKLSIGQSVYFGGICLVLFAITFSYLRAKQAKWLLPYIFWTNTRMTTLLSTFFYLLALGAVISMATFGDIRLTMVGLLFYLIPLFAIWTGFQIGLDIKAVKVMLQTYLFACSVTALSVLISLWGVENKLLEEVGTGLDITGIGTRISGLWRTSEIAGWHLASGSCFAFLLGLCNKKTFVQILYFLLSLSLVFLASTTARRKSVGLVIIFVGLTMLLYTFAAKRKRYVQIISAVIVVLFIGLGTLGLALNEKAQTVVAETSERTSTITLDTSKERFSIQGLKAMQKGIALSGPFGFGLGAGSNLSNSGISRSGAGVDLSFVVEGGGGRIIAEVGWVGGILLLVIIINMLIMIRRNFYIGLSCLETDDFMLLSGLTVFTVANAFTFFTGAQLYSDPFVLLVIGLTFGASLAIVVVSSQNVYSSRKSL